MKLLLIGGVLFVLTFSSDLFGQSAACTASCSGLPPAMQSSCMAACGGATGGTGATGGIPGMGGGSGGIPITLAATPGMQTAINNANTNWNNSNTNWADSNALWSQVLSGKDEDGNPNTVAQGIQVANDANANWATTNSILDRVARPEFALAMSAATAVGGFLGTAAIEGVTSLLIEGASWIYSSLHELITNDREKARLLEGYQSAERLYGELSQTRDNLFQALNKSLQDLKVHEELREMGFQADLRQRLGEVQEEGAQFRRMVREGRDDVLIDLRVDLDRTRAYMRDPLALSRDCYRRLMTQAERLNASISSREMQNTQQVEEYESLSRTMQEVIDRIGPEANPKIYICNKLNEQINNLFRIETEMQRARASLIAGHFVMLTHQDELSQQARDLFEDGLRFSDTDALEDYIEDVLDNAANTTERVDARRAHVAALNSHRRTEELFESMRDGNIPVNANLELRGSRLSRGSRIRTIRQEQLCAVNPLECESLGVRDYRTEGIRYYGELADTCSDTVEGMREDYNDVMDGLSYGEMVAVSDVGDSDFNLSEDRRNEIELPMRVDQAIREVSSARRELRQARGPEARARAQRNLEAAEANESFAKLRLAQFQTRQVAQESREARARASDGNAGRDGIAIGQTARYYEKKAEELRLRADALEHIDGQIVYHENAVETAQRDLALAQRNLEEVRRVAEQTHNPVDQRRALAVADVVTAAQERIDDNQRLLAEMRTHKQELDSDPDKIARFRQQAIAADRRSLEFNITSNQRLAEFYRASGDNSLARRHETQVARYQMRLQGFVDRHGN